MPNRDEIQEIRINENSFTSEQATRHVDGLKSLRVAASADSMGT